MARISVNKESCLGCRICEIICSAAHMNAYNPRFARIRVPLSYPLPSPPKVCRHCPNPKCVENCPTGALWMEDRLMYDSDLCTSCGDCIEACPFDAIWMAPDDKVVSCDLCGGEPSCVPACPGEALSLRSGGKRK